MHAHEPTNGMAVTLPPDFIINYIPVLLCCHHCSFLLILLRKQPSKTKNNKERGRGRERGTQTRQTDRDDNICPA